MTQITRRLGLPRLMLLAALPLLAACADYVNYAAYGPEPVPIASYYRDSIGVNGWNRASRPHIGIDILGRQGEDILAAADGVVQPSRGSGGCGNGILLHHGVGDTDHRTLYTLYCHLDAVSVTVGQAVRRGEVIGKMGRTGWTSRVTHLHFTVCNAACVGSLDTLALPDTLDPLAFIAGCFDPATPVAPALTPAGAPRLTLTYPVRCQHRKRAN